MNGNDGVCRVALGSKCESAWSADRAAHGFDRVDDQVENDLLQLNAVGAHRWQRIRQIGRDGHQTTGGLAIGQLDHLRDHVVEPALISAGRRISHQRANRAQDIGGAAAVGTVIGAIAGGGKGAAIGALAGGGAGTGVVLATRGDPAVLPSESVINTKLASPFSVTERQAGSIVKKKAPAPAPADQPPPSQ